MEREVFIQPSGESTLAWELRFGTPQQHVETQPATEHESGGLPVRNGRVYITVETREATFCAHSGSVAVGQKGQLSSKDDQFFDMAITAVEAAGDHILVTGRASRSVDIKFEWDR